MNEVVARTCGDESPEAGRKPTQQEWYQYALRFVESRSVLDAGCGLGHGLDILRTRAARAEGQDLDTRLSREDVRIVELRDIPSKSYDVVTSIDVIEHVENPLDFVAHLARIAREGMFLTTPNWTASRCEWPYHLREYTPREFFNLLRGAGHVTLFKGSTSGSVIHPVQFPKAYFLLNGLRNLGPTAFFTRCVNRLLPSRFKIHSSNAAWVKVA